MPQAYDANRDDITDMLMGQNKGGALGAGLGGLASAMPAQSPVMTAAQMSPTGMPTASMGMPQPQQQGMGGMPMQQGLGAMPGLGSLGAMPSLGGGRPQRGVAPNGMMPQMAAPQGMPRQRQRMY